MIAAAIKLPLDEKRAFPAEPLADETMTDEFQADRGQGRTNDDAGGGMEHLREENTRKLRRDGNPQRTYADGDHRQSGQQALTFQRVDQCSARQLAEERDDAADGQYETDISVGPFFRCQIDGQEWTEPRLDISQEERKPVDADLAFCRRDRYGRL